MLPPSGRIHRREDSLPPISHSLAFWCSKGVQACPPSTTSYPELAQSYHTDFPQSFRLITTLFTHALGCTTDLQSPVLVSCCRQTLHPPVPFSFADVCLQHNAFQAIKLEPRNHSARKISFTCSSTGLLRGSLHTHDGTEILINYAFFALRGYEGARRRLALALLCLYTFVKTPLI